MLDKIKICLNSVWLISVLGILFSASQIQSQPLENNFVHFTNKDGLPSNEAHVMLQDHLGYIWIGTNNGVSRYDGYEFVNFSPVKNDTNFLPLPLISSLFEDSNGDLWIGAIGGIIKYNRENESFKLFEFNEYEKEENVTLFVTSISETNSKDILFTTVTWLNKHTNYGLYQIEYKSDELSRVNLSNKEIAGELSYISSIGDDKFLIAGVQGIGSYNNAKKSLKWFPLEESTIVTSVFPDNKGVLWLGTYNKGLIKYSTKDSTYASFKIINEIDYENDSFVINKIITYENNNLLLATNHGLILFNLDSKKTFITKIDQLNPSALHSNNLRNIFQDNTGSIWISTYDAGISKHNTNSKFQSFSNNSNNPKSIPPGWAHAIFEYNENELWLQSGNGVISIFDRKKKEFNNIQVPQISYIRIIYKDPSNQIWFAGLDGILKVDPLKWKFDKIDIPLDMEKHIIFILLEDSKGTFWFGANDGLYTYDRLNKSIAKTDFQTLGIGSSTSNATKRLIEDSEKNIWIGTDDGLFKYNITNKQYSRIGNSKDPSKSFNSQIINSLYVDIHDKVWVGTWLGGLNSYDPKTGKFESFTKKDGLKTHSVQGILGDEENGALWLSTFDGIIRLDLEKKTFNNFDMEDGIQGNQFADASALKTSNSEFIFGGSNGMSIFKSDDMQKNQVPPKVVITAFKLFNETVKPESGSPLKKPIYNTKNIDLNYDENDISFDFFAAHYVNPKRNQYAYRLINYNDEWRYVGNQRTAIFPNLPPGEYEFQVKAANSNGVWNEEGKSVFIKILPPWWKTTFAYISYGFLFIGFIFTVDRLQRKRLLNKAKERMKIQQAEHRAESAELLAQTAETKAKLVQTENERKTAELEEARQLQLSMLPKELPELLNLDIAVYMKTATEVGGDYYDFHVSLDGTLTTVVGDATGHGMRAGTMVTSTKSLFSSYAESDDIINTFHEMTRCIKNMHLDNLSMCMTMIKIEKDQIRMSSAGMPPVYIYRKNTSSVEEYLFQGMPLGTMSNFPYEVRETSLSKGDTILLMSDGFPELVNDENEMFGYKRAKHIFEEVATESPENIVSKLKDAGSGWMNDKDPDDDVTFVVIKVK